MTKELAAESLPMIAIRSKAPATVKKYAGGFNRWKRWADSKPGIDPFPVKKYYCAARARTRDEATHCDSDGIK